RRRRCRPHGISRGTSRRGDRPGVCENPGKQSSSGTPKFLVRQRVAAVHRTTLVWRRERGEDNVFAGAGLSTGADIGNARLANGMTDALITALARAGRFRVSSATSSFALRGRPIDARAAGDRLGAWKERSMSPAIARG